MKILLLVSLAAALCCGCASNKPVAPASGQGLAPCPDSPNCVSSLEKKGSRYVAPLDFTTDPKAAMDRLAAVISAMPGVKIEERGEGYIHATFTSKVFGFVDDLTARMDAPGHCIQVRSAARSGYYDFGVNKGRIEKIREAFNEGR